MLLLFKGKTYLQVHYDNPDQLHVTAVAGEFDNSALLAALARNEELLAQVFLQKTHPNDVKTRLQDYFTERGWQVQHLEHSR